MNAPILFDIPLSQLVITIVVSAVVAAIVARLMTGSRGERESAFAAAPRRSEPPARDEGAVIAAISAAVYAVVGPHRIVYVSAARPVSGWAAQIRSQHHASHLPHQPHTNPIHH